MKYVGTTLEEVLTKASEEEYVEKDELVYDVLVNEEGRVEIEVYSIVKLISLSTLYLNIYFVHTASTLSSFTTSTSLPSPSISDISFNA